MPHGGHRRRDVLRDLVERRSSPLQRALRVSRRLRRYLDERLSGVVRTQKRGKGGDTYDAHRLTLRAADWLYLSALLEILERDLIAVQGVRQRQAHHSLAQDLLDHRRTNRAAMEITKGTRELLEHWLQSSTYLSTPEEVDKFLERFFRRRQALAYRTPEMLPRAAIDVVSAALAAALPAPSPAADHQSPPPEADRTPPAAD